MSTNRARKDYTGFVCDFGDLKSMNSVLKRDGVEIPEEWNLDPSNFIVVEDNGRTMTIKFYDWDSSAEKSFGEEFEIDYDDAHYWA